MEGVASRNTEVFKSLVQERVFQKKSSVRTCQIGKAQSSKQETLRSLIRLCSVFVSEGGGEMKLERAGQS